MCIEKFNNNFDKTEILKMKIEVWKTIIETQKHFNDLEMKVRNFSILILSALISATGLSYKSGYMVDMAGFNVALATVFSFASVLIWLLFYFVDVYWYHPLLKGAVLQGIKIEKELRKDMPSIGLTTKIGESSPKKILGFEIRSTGKANIFYLGVTLVLVLMLVSTMLSTDQDKVKSRNNIARPPGFSFNQIERCNRPGAIRDVCNKEQPIFYFYKYYDK